MRRCQQASDLDHIVKVSASKTDQATSKIPSDVACFLLKHSDSSLLRSVLETNLPGLRENFHATISLQILQDGLRDLNLPKT